MPSVRFAGAIYWKSDLKQVSSRHGVDFSGPKRDHHVMPQVIERDAFYWLMGGVIGVAVVGLVDVAALDELGRWAFHWLVEPFTRLAYFGAFCG